MPSAKRSKTSRSRAITRRSSKMPIYPKQKTWPYRTPGWGPMWDPFPNQATAIMRYSEVISLNPGIATPAAYLFRANSIFDPNFSGIGHQPYGHDTYSSIYNHYCVTSSVITVQSTTSANGVFGVSVTDDTVVQADYDTIRETKGTAVATMLSGGSPPKIYQKYNRRAQFGDLQNVNAQSANFGANPAELSIFHLWAEGTDSGADPGVFKFMVTITYVVRMWELKDLGQS